MSMALYTIYICVTLLILLFIIPTIYTEVSIKVYIGVPGNPDNSIKVYSWPFYKKEAFLPIYLGVQNVTTGLELTTISENVTVCCEQNPNLIGFSRIIFTCLDLVAPNIDGNVLLKFLRPGRPVQVQCFCMSDCFPKGSRILNQDPPCEKNTSISEPRVLVIKTSPVVNICDITIIVPIKNLSWNTGSSITVKFSEKTTTSVDVYCQQEDSGSAKAMEIKLYNVTVSRHTVFAEVPYNVTKLGSPVNVFCEAVSSEGNQYTPTVSRGSPGLFQKNQLSLNFIPPDLKVKSLVFQIYLHYSTWIVEENLNIECKVIVKHCSQDTASTADECFPIPYRHASIKNLSILWILDKYTIKINGGSSYILLQLKRSNLKEYVKELVTIYCEETSVPILTAKFSAFVSVGPPVTYNISNLDSTEQAMIINPTSNNFTECNCDLKVMECDFNCCCDLDCKGLKKLNSHLCAFENGRMDVSSVFECKQVHFFKEIFLSNLSSCVYVNEKGFIGRYYEDEPLIFDNVNFQKIWSSNMSYSWQNSLSSDDESGNVIKGNMLPAMYNLPQTIFNGYCIPSAPLRFLQDITSECTYILDSSTCSANSVFSSRHYVLSSSLTDSNCDSSNSEEKKDIDVNYYCTDNVSPYIKDYKASEKDLSQQLFKDSVDCLFNKTFCTHNAWVGRVDRIGQPSPVDPLCMHGKTDVNLMMMNVNGDNPFKTRCSWDNSFTSPPTPVVRWDNNEAFCDNVVLRVSYKFIVNGAKIQLLNASIVLGNVPMSTLSNNAGAFPASTTSKRTSSKSEYIAQLTLHFEVNYVHTSKQSERKGTHNRYANPGYLPSQPINSGVAILNAAESFSFVEQSATQQLYVWNPVLSDLCTLAGQRQIMFREDVFSGCSVPFFLQENCLTMRNIIFSVLDKLIPSDRIGRFANSNANIEPHWINIFRPDKLNDTSRSELNVTYCDFMPVGLNIELMYAVTGYVHDVAIKEIIGAKISYVFQNWTIYCNDNQSDLCLMKPNIMEIKGDFKLVRLYAAVTFIHVPPKPPVRNMSIPEEEYIRRLVYEFTYPYLIPTSLHEYAYNITLYTLFLLICFVAIPRYGLFFEI